MAFLETWSRIAGSTAPPGSEPLPIHPGEVRIEDAHQRKRLLQLAAVAGYGMPGEPGGIPESVAYHDVAHVLAQHDTTPAGEILQGCFQGGNRREDGFFFIQFAILQFHHGIRLTPVAQGEVGYFHPVKVLWAIHRGASCSVDMTHQWNYWPLMSLGLGEARALCGLLPASDPQLCSVAA